MMKQWKMIMSAVVVAIAANTSFAEDTKPNLPKGWELHSSGSGKYDLNYTSAAGANNRRFVLSSNSSATDSDFVAITKTVDVSKLQGQAAFLSVFLRGTGPLANKDIWLRYFGRDGELFSQQVEMFEDDDTVLRDKLSPSFLKTVVPFGATQMEVGIGFKGKGTFELRRLTFNLIAETPDMPKMVKRDPLVKQIKKLGAVSDIDPLTLGLEE